MSDDVLKSLRAAGLEPRDGVPGLFLLRDDRGRPVVPTDGIMLEGKAQAQAERMRDELASLLQEKGIDAVPDKDLTGAWLVKANLEEAQLKEANLGEAQLEKANLRGAQLKEANLGEAQLKEANLGEAQLKEANLGGAQLEKANLARAQLEKADLGGAQLEKANLAGAQLEKADLGGAQLEKAILYEAQLKEADLRGAQLEKAILAFAQLEKADLENAQLQEANLTGAKLRCANFTGTNLTKAKLDEAALKTMTNYRPPRPPTVRAKGAWRVKAVASSVSSALYQQLAQDDSGGDDDDDEVGASDDGEEGSANIPWQEQATWSVVDQAVEGLIAVAQPVLALVEPTITELESLCDALSQDIPLTLVHLVPLDASSKSLKPMVSEHLHALLEGCVLELVFDKALPDMMKAMQKQLEEVVKWAKKDPAAELKPLLTMRDALMIDLHKLRKKIIEDQKFRFKEKLAAVRSNVPEQLAQSDAESLPPPATDAPLPEESASPAPPPPREQVEDAVQLEDHLCDFSLEVLQAVTESLIEPLCDRDGVNTYLKQPALVRVGMFVTEAAGPITDALLRHQEKLKAASKGDATKDETAPLPSVLGFLKTFRDDLCKKTLRRRVSQHLLESLPSQMTHGAMQKLAVAERIEAQLCARLQKLGDDNAKLLRRHLPLNGIRGRAFEAVLKTATKYKVRVGGFEGSVDMALMAWRRGRVALTTDENELQYLLDELAKLKEKESTASNWRDAAEGWISVLELRGKLRVECGQAVLECVCSDEKVLEALGASKVLMQTDGEAPAGLVRYIAQGPGAHIRKHGYGYTKRLNKEIAIVRRVKELQVRAVAGLGTLLVATAVAVGNYFSRVMYDGVTNGFATQSWLTWVLPFAAVAALILVGLVGVAAYLCREGIFRKTLRGCCSASRCGCSFGAKKARVSPGAGFIEKFE